MLLSLLQAGLQTAAVQYSPTENMNTLLYIDGNGNVNGYRNVTLVRLDGMSENCDLEDYPVPWPAAVTYSDKDGQVLACGGLKEANADHCWQLDGSTWSPLPKAGQKHCAYDSPNVMVDDGWWITGKIQYPSSTYAQCSDSASEIFTGEDWIPGPALPGDELYAEFACMVNLNNTHTMLIGGYKYETLKEVWLYDWSTQEWMKTGSLNQGRAYHGCVSLGDQGVLVAGGSDVDTHVNTVELYNPTEGTWSYQQDLPLEINNKINQCPILLNWNNQIIALFWDQDQVYKWSKENDEWTVLEGVRLPEKNLGYVNDKAILVPDDFAPSCN